METQCEYCGQELKQTPGRRAKKYCGDRCRMAYWNSHPEAVNRRTYPVICANCGRTFESTRSAGRIYCSLACYVEMRDVKKGLAAVRVQQLGKAEIRGLRSTTGSQAVEMITEESTLSKRARIVMGTGDFPEPRQIWLICGTTWFSGKIDHFAANVPSDLSERLMEGDGFVFCNKHRDLLSLLQWQGDGFALYYKRLEYGQYPWPKIWEGTRIVEISSEDFRLLLTFPDFISRCERGDFSPLGITKEPVADILF